MFPRKNTVDEIWQRAIFCASFSQRYVLDEDQDFSSLCYTQRDNLLTVIAYNLRIIEVVLSRVIDAEVATSVRTNKEN